MSRFISLIRFILNTTFLLVALAAAMITISLADKFNPQDSRITIDSGPSLIDLSLNPETHALYALLEVRADEINTSLSDDPSPVPFSVQDGETGLAVAENLQKANLIKDARLFEQLLRYNNLDTRLKAGDYWLRRNMTMREIGLALYTGRSGQVVITIFPGWRIEQVGVYLANRKIMDGDEFIRQAYRGTAVNHDLLADRPPEQSYEGYLFPDTYYLPDNTNPTDLIHRMVTNMASKLPSNALNLAEQRGLTFYEVLTLAAIVERETTIPEERPIIASVYLNRLKLPPTQAYLQADPTVQYALGYQAATSQWWKVPLKLEDYSAIDTPYNTYLYPGLPPGPIASPSLDSILAVLQPANTDYLFFVCRQPNCEGGDHVFAKTYEEHLRNVEAYYNTP